jgi:hypothetical protein
LRQAKGRADCVESDMIEAVVVVVVVVAIGRKRFAIPIDARWTSPRESPAKRDSRRDERPMRLSNNQYTNHIANTRHIPHHELGLYTLFPAPAACCPGRPALCLHTCILHRASAATR